MNQSTTFFIALLATLTFFSTAVGGQLTWNGSKSDHWNDSRNWTPEAVPTISDTVTIPSAPRPAKIDNGVPEVPCGALIVGPGGIFNVSSNSRNLNVAGDIQIQSLGTVNFTADAIVRVGGNWINNGSFVTTPTNSGTVEFNGTTQQTLSGQTVFFDLTVNNASGVAFTGNHEVKHTLTLQNGKVQLGENTLTLRATATIAGASATRYILTNGSGSLVRNNVGTAVASFPVGTSSSYNPVTLGTTTGVDTFSVRVRDGVWPVVPNSQSAVLKTWNLSESIPGGNGMLHCTLQWNAADQGTEFAALDAGLWKYTGSAWGLDAPVAGIVTGGNPYSGPFDVTSLGAFVVANSSTPLPIQLASFTGTVVNEGSVQLDWTTISETNNFGFEVQRSVNATAYETIPGSFIPGHGTTNEPQHYTYTDNPGTGTWYYRLKQIDLDATIHYSDGIQVDVLTTGVDETTPQAFRLEQNYPNPFNPTTEIRFSVTDLQHTSLVVYNTLGQEVSTLFQGIAEPGRQYTVKFTGDGLASGVYYYRLSNGSLTELKKMLLMK